MISIKVTPKSSKLLYNEIQNKIDGVKEFNTAITRRQLMSAAFSIGSMDFVKKTHVLSRSLKKSFHHVYEWNQVGTESGRLYRIIKRNETGGSGSIYYKFNNSRKKSPIDPGLKSPGRTGKVVTTSGIFKRKAEVMEDGQSVSFLTSRTIAFMSSDGIKFIPEGKLVKIRKPGGDETTGSFEKHFRVWWMTNFPHILVKAGVVKKLEMNLARALNKKNAGRYAAKQAISQTLNKYTLTGSVI